VKFILSLACAFKAHSSYILLDMALVVVGELNYVLCIEFQHTKFGTIMHQTKYARALLSKFGMQNCNSTATSIETSLKLGKEPGKEQVDHTSLEEL